MTTVWILFTGLAQPHFCHVLCQDIYIILLLPLDYDISLFEIMKYEIFTIEVGEMSQFIGKRMRMCFSYDQI